MSLSSHPNSPPFPTLLLHFILYFFFLLFLLIWPYYVYGRLICGTGVGTGVQISFFFLFLVRNSQVSFLKCPILRKKRHIRYLTQQAFWCMGILTFVLCIFYFFFSGFFSLGKCTFFVVLRHGHGSLYFLLYLRIYLHCIIAQVFWLQLFVQWQIEAGLLLLSSLFLTLGARIKQYDTITEFYPPQWLVVCGY